MPRQLRVFACLALFLVSMGTVVAQTTPIYVPDNLPASGGGNVIPLGSFPPYGAFTYVAGISASFLNPGVPLVHEVSFAPWNSTGTGTFACSTIQMGFGHVPTPLPATFNYPSFDPAGNVTALGSFLDYTPIYNSVSQGPFSWLHTQNTWSPMGFGTTGGTQFVWNGVNDIAFYITWSGATGLTACFTQGSNPLRRWNSGVYQAAASAGGDSVGLKMKLDMRAPGPPVYQLNQAGASFDVNGVQSAGYLPAAVSVVADGVCSFGTVTINWSSTYLGFPYDIGLTPSALLPLGGGGFTTAGNGIVNLNLGDPGLAFLFGFGFAIPFANASFPYSPGTIPMSISGQMLVMDGGTSPDGFRLSQGATYNVTQQSTSPVAGPTGDDTFITYTLGQGPLCPTGPSMPFYGTNYTQVSVTTNGRIMWNGADASYTPSVASAIANPGFIGAWSDLYVGLPAGVVNITTPTYGIFRADWVGVPYFPGTGSTTFGVQFDSTSGFMQIDGLTFSQGASMLIGTSRGAGATDPGMTTFASFIGLGLQAAPAGTGMIYVLGTGGTLTPGCTSILFAPNGSGNYNFAVY